MNQPSVFISSVSPEFRQTRSRVAAILTRLGYTPVTQEIFGTEPGDLRQVLRDKIDACEGLIQIVGQGYGAEPAEADADYGRVSYTQFEFLYARAQKKRPGSSSPATLAPVTYRWTASTFPFPMILRIRILPATRLSAALCSSPTAINGETMATFTTTPPATPTSSSRSSVSAMSSPSWGGRSSSGRINAFSFLFAMQLTV